MMRSKKKRQQKGLPEPEKIEKSNKGPKQLGTIMIDVYEDMNVNVRQFPTDHGMAVLLIGNALLAVNNWFVEQKQQEKSNIVLAKPGVSMADIEKMKKNN